MTDTQLAYLALLAAALVGGGAVVVGDWLEAGVRVARRLPALVGIERNQLRRERRLLRDWRQALATSTWQCEMHAGDVWREPSGRFMSLRSGLLLPITGWDAEDFHGYRSEAVA